MVCCLMIMMMFLFESLFLQHIWRFGGKCNWGNVKGQYNNYIIDSRKELYMSHSFIFYECFYGHVGDSGASSIGEGLKKNSTLKSLNLKGVV